MFILAVTCDSGCVEIDVTSVCKPIWCENVTRKNDGCYNSHHYVVDKIVGKNWADVKYL